MFSLFKFNPLIFIKTIDFHTKKGIVYEALCHSIYLGFPCMEGSSSFNLSPISWQVRTRIVRNGAVYNGAGCLKDREKTVLF
jgi:hypothetical protein